MLDHGIILKCPICTLRPMTDADEKNVLRLWNEDFVIGNLFMSRTSPETYRRYFDLYKAATGEYRWVVEDATGKFVGTMGAKIETIETVFSNFLAFYPTETPVMPAAYVLFHDFIFGGLGAMRLDFTVVTSNRKVKGLCRLVGSVDSGERIVKTASNGETITLEKWSLAAGAWRRNRTAFESIIK